MLEEVDEERKRNVKEPRMDGTERAQQVESKLFPKCHVSLITLPLESQVSFPSYPYSPDF